MSKTFWFLRMPRPKCRKSWQTRRCCHVSNAFWTRLLKLIWAIFSLKNFKMSRKGVFSQKIQEARGWKNSKKIQELSCCRANCLVPNCRFWCNELQLELWWPRFATLKKLAIPPPSFIEETQRHLGAKILFLISPLRTCTTNCHVEEETKLCSLWVVELNVEWNKQANKEKRKAQNKQIKNHNQTRVSNQTWDTFKSRHSALTPFNFFYK